jgi:molecular chaperone IbpA
MEDVLMNAFDFSPLYRSTVGFDQLASLLDSVLSDSNQQSFPPYNIERTGENEYRISMAVAGFSQEELGIEARQNLLTITGRKEEKPESANDKVRVLHRGIATRSFERRFQLADHVEVRGASLENGLLHVDLVREIPETMKPRQIAIGQAGGTKTIESKAAD